MATSDHLGPQYELPDGRNYPSHGSLVPKGTVLYRGQTDGSDTAGIHWTTRRDSASSMRLGRDDFEVMEVTIDDPEKQVIPHSVLREAKMDHVGRWDAGTPIFDQKTGLPKVESSSPQGLPSEEEIRLRPGAVFKTNGRNITIDGTKGRHLYPNLYRYAATPAAAGKEWDHAVRRLGHIQGALFNDVIDGKGTVKGHIAEFGLDADGDIFESAKRYNDEVLKYGPNSTVRSMERYTPPTGSSDGR